MSKFRMAVGTGFAATALLLIPAGSASAHVHGISPLECTPAPLNSGDNAGAFQGVDQAADAAVLGGVIPQEKSVLDTALTGGQNAPVPLCP